VTAVFAFTLVDNVLERPDGVLVASFFIALILSVSAFSRFRAAKDLRVAVARYADDDSAVLGATLRHKRVHLVPMRVNSRAARERKSAEIRRHYLVEGPMAFVHVELLDNRSEFLAPLPFHVTREGDDIFIRVTGAVAIANTISYVSELIDPRSLFLGLTRRNLMTQSLRHLLWGEGETGPLVYAILVRYWEWTPEEDVRPLIFLMSD
jgi:hypothetical protein